jgi:hypothetical protein
MEFSRTEVQIAGCLRRLLRGRFILRSRNEAQYKTILDLREDLQKVVIKMGATLEVNEILGLAYLRPYSADLEEAIGFQLGSTRMLNRMTSLLLLYLRSRRLLFFQNPEQADLPMVERSELRMYLSEYVVEKEDRKVEREFRASLEELVELQVLLPFNENYERFEISPVTDILMNASAVDELRKKIEGYFQVGKSIEVSGVTEESAENDEGVL